MLYRENCTLNNYQDILKHNTTTKGKEKTTKPIKTNIKINKYASTLFCWGNYFNCNLIQTYQLSSDSWSISWNSKTSLSQIYFKRSYSRQGSQCKMHNVSGLRVQQLGHLVVHIKYMPNLHLWNGPPLPPQCLLQLKAEGAFGACTRC